MVIKEILANQKVSLYASAKHGHLDVVKLLLEQDPSQINVADAEGYTPLHFAAEGGRLEAVRLLLEYGAHVNLSTNTGCTPLWLALKEHIEVVRLLLERGASVNSVNNKGNTPLSFAAREGKVEVVKLLLGHGGGDRQTQINTVNPDGFSPLHLAAKYGRLEVVRLLLENGALVNLVTNTGRTSVAMTTCTGIMKLLLERGANVALDATKGNTSLSFAAQVGNLEVVQLLLDQGASVGSGKHSASPLLLALRNNHFDVAKLLISRGQPMDKILCAEAAYACVKNNRLDIIELLATTHTKMVVNDADLLHDIVNSIDERSNDILCFLINNGANLDVIIEEEEYNDDDFGGTIRYTPLHTAVLTDQESKVWQLVLHGADTTITTQYGSRRNPRTVWQFDHSKSMRAALLHFWTPSTHKLHPIWTREAIKCTLLVAKRLGWPFDQSLLMHILAYLAYGWYTKRMLTT